MAQGQLASVIRRIRKLLGPRPGADSSDGELLERFVASHDETAFAALVERYGPLVLGLCRRMLRDASTAEDAFQATFFVLARKAGSIRHRQSVGSWLYGVALRTARRSRLNLARRRAVEVQAVVSRPLATGAEPMEPTAPAADPTTEADWNELRDVLDEELQRLPAKYHQPLRLCYLEGKSNEEAAQLLGWPKGSVQGRLARGRDLLRQRLSRRGVALSAGALGTILADRAAPAAVAAPLTEATVHGATRFAVGQATAALPAPVVALADEVLKGMMTAKLRWLLAVVLLLALGGGVALYALASRPSRQPQRDELAQKAPPRFAYRERTAVKTADVNWLALSADGKLLATANDMTGALSLWDARTGNLRAELNLEQLQPGFGGLQFSPNAEQLLVLRGGQFAVWDLAREKPVMRNLLQADGGGYADAAFLPDGKRFVVSRYEYAAAGAFQPIGTVPTVHLVLELWDASTGKQVRTIKETEAVQTDKPKGNYDPFDVQGNSARMSPYLLSAAPDGKSVAIMNWQHSSSPRLWDLGANKLSSLPCKGQGYRVSYSADGKALIVQTATDARLDGGLVVTPGKHQQVPWTIEIWDPSAKKMQARLNGVAFAVCRDGLLVADARGTVSLVDVPSGQTKASFAAHAAAAATRARVDHGDPFNGFGPNREFVEDFQGGVRDLVVTPDGKTLATAAEKVKDKKRDGEIDSWEIKVWERPAPAEPADEPRP
jgi:RNA polymerase sigma factor (sigma-70 family)